MKCPACQRNILTRRSGVCSFCGVALPADLLLSKEQLATLEADERAADTRRKERRGVDPGWVGGDSTYISDWGGGDSGGGDSGGGGD